MVNLPQSSTKCKIKSPILSAKIRTRNMMILAAVDECHAIAKATKKVRKQIPTLSIDLYKDAVTASYLTAEFCLLRVNCELSYV